jgi:riboflavin synthase
VFTGLVQATGGIEARSVRGPGLRLAVRSDLTALELGESVSVNGACLTVVAATRGRFEADISRETAAVTTLGMLPIGTPVNLERSLRLSDRLGGHLVSGHVDASVGVLSVEPAGEARRVVVALPRSLAAFVAPKGSVALDGVSLTVNDVGPDCFSVMLIPETLRATTLGALDPGRQLNLEVDLLARYAVRWLEVSGAARTELDPAGAADGLRAALERSGWM